MVENSTRKPLLFAVCGSWSLRAAAAAAAASSLKHAGNYKHAQARAEADTTHKISSATDSNNNNSKKC